MHQEGIWKYLHILSLPALLTGNVVQLGFLVHELTNSLQKNTQKKAVELHLKLSE